MPIEVKLILAVLLGAILTLGLEVVAIILVAAIGYQWRGK